MHAASLLFTTVLTLAGGLIWGVFAGCKGTVGDSSTYGPSHTCMWGTNAFSGAPDVARVTLGCVDVKKVGEVGLSIDMVRIMCGAEYSEIQGTFIEGKRTGICIELVSVVRCS